MVSLLFSKSFIYGFIPDYHYNITEDKLPYVFKNFIYLSLFFVLAPGVLEKLLQKLKLEGNLIGWQYLSRAHKELLSALAVAEEELSIA